MVVSLIEQPEQQLITLKEAAGLFPSNPCQATMLRRVRRGQRGVKLNAVFDGAWYTTAEWVDEFISALTATKSTGKSRGRSSRRAVIGRANSIVE